MNFSVKSLILLCTIVLVASKCPPDDTEQAPDKSPLKITLFDSLSVDYDDNSRRLPENIRNLCAVIVSEDKDCNRTFILDPSLSRLDLGKSLSLKTIIEKGGAKNVSNPKVIGKLIQKNFDELEIPKEFTMKATDKNINDKLNQLITVESKNDSILIFNEGSSVEEYSVNGKSYKVLTSFEEVRNKITTVLCQNEKANFTLLVNPPSVPASLLTLKVVGPDCKTGKLAIKTSGGDGSNITYSAVGLSTGQSDNTFTIPKQDRNGKSFTFIANQNGVSSQITQVLNCRPEIEGPGNKPLTVGIRRTSSGADKGDLSMIKDSEGCDVCTRYYSATDKLGRTRQITEKNSIFCCPCGKTIEMKGRTYRMECDGAGSNRLALVQ